LKLQTKPRRNADSTLAIQRVNEAASKHRWSPCAVGSALPLFPTKPHRGTLLNHLIPRGNKFFRRS
jgi:hypothetical protein